MVFMCFCFGVKIKIISTLVLHCSLFDPGVIDAPTPRITLESMIPVFFVNLLPWKRAF